MLVNIVVYYLLIYKIKAMNIKNFVIVVGLILMCCACQSNRENKPTFIPAIEVKTKPDIKHPLGIIGAVEPVYVMPIKSSFLARIDTGAETSSIDVDEYHYFERDGAKWIAFTIVNSSSGEKYAFEKRLIKNVTIRRINENEKRPIVELDIKMGKQIIKAKFSLAKRDKFDYQVLIGRNILTGRAIVDTALENTLH